MQLLIRNKGPQVVCPAHPNQVRTADIQNVFCRSVCRKKYIMVDLKGTWKPERTAVRCSDGCVPGRVPASKASVPTLAIFARPKAPRKCLLGSLPKPRRRRKLHIPRPAVNGRAYSFRCASSPHANPVCAGTPLWDKVSHRSVCGTAPNGSVPYRRVRR